jgi:hypothetical protein
MDKPNLYKMNRYITIILLLFVTIAANAHPLRKKFTIHKCIQAPRIDGLLNDKAWESASFREDFIQQGPHNGAAPTEKTHVKLLYDDQALYVGAMLYDSAPDSILTGYGLRDAGDQLNADFFSIEINPYNDSRSAMEFMVSASGIQMDSRNTVSTMNKNWNAVWESRVRITKEGWMLEMRIPYSALRFPKQKIQVWEMNFFRMIKRKNEGITWNFVNKEVFGWLNQAGELHGIENVTPPLRLSFTPYFSTYAEKYSNSSDISWSTKGGMDVKYGINESFTLDMMLIPDFGQVQSDDQQLNLTPFETFFEEKRSFFTEGTEIFNKGDIFYSRRLGSAPRSRDRVINDMNKNEVILSNPQETQLLNATKISGRTAKGLGVGFLNAITENTYAKIKDTITGNSRKELTQGFTNYNMIVLDQSLGNQSHLSLANTHRLEPKSDYRAMVTASEFKLANKKETYAFSGNAAMSQIKSGNDNQTGYRYHLQFSKIKGRFQYDLSHHLEDDQFNPNDMGFLEVNNRIINKACLNYNFFKPFGKFNEITNQLVVEHHSLYHPNRFAKMEIYWKTQAVFRNYNSLALEWSLTPVPKYDYYEPRVEGWKYKEPTDYWMRLSYNTDHRKALALDSKIAFWQGTTFDKSSYWLELQPQWRVNDKLVFNHHFYYEKNLNSLGYAAQSEDASDIFFVNRDINTLINTFESHWIFNQRASIRIRARHYWSEVEYKECYLLNRNGSMNSNTDYENKNHINYNAFNVDLTYSWEFAPGSELSVVWKNSIDTQNQNINFNYFDNLNRTLKSTQNNSLSLRILYYIDYQRIIKNKKSRKA